MKSKKKSVLFLVLVLLGVLFTSMGVLSVSAEPSSIAEPSKEIYAEISEVNPLYSDQISEEDLITPDENRPVSIFSYDVYTTVEDAGEELRCQMKDRIKTVVIQYEMPMTCSYDSLMGDISKCALEHTGVPTEGDYLLYQYAGWEGSLRGNSSGGKYHLTLTYTITYYTDAAQEQAVDEKISQVMEELNLRDCSDYQKIKKIYDYICANVTYDYTNLEDESYDLKYTAYAALINGTSVCQGYAILLYRMLLEAGIDNRIVGGTGGGDSHGWNIVKLGDVYYNADSTWDAGQSKYSYFLKDEADFTNHTRGTFGSIDYTSEAFYQQYPMSVVSYTPCAENIHTWSTEYTIDREATCTQNGSKSIHCTNCGEIDEKTITAIEMTEHEYGEWKVTDVATCVGVGSQKRLCKNCGYSEVQEIPATGHIWSTEYTIDKEATCTQEGSQSIHCTKCDEKTEVKSRPATGHIHTEIQRKISATCTAKGYTGDTYCKDCNKVIKKGTSVSKIAHTYDSGKITKEATCLATGEKTYTCKKCKYQAKEPIQKLKAVVTLKKTSTTIAVGKTVTETWVKSMTKGDYVKSFTSSNSKVATISGKKTGVCTVKGIKAGTTTMTLKFASGLTKKVTVKVKDIVCTKISGVKSSVSVKVNKTYKLTPTITPSNCTQKITYSSSNAKIAKVSSSGKITGVKKGTCRVYVQCGSKKITVKVTVL